MNDNIIKNYAIWARRELMAEVEKRCAWWGISESAQVDIDSIDGRVLSAQERKQRGDLLRIVRADGYAQLVEKAAYTWFNRLLAIRFMEVNDRLPSHVRILSSTSGGFEPQCLREALDLPLDALNKDEAVRLVQAGDDETLFHLVFLAQCDELSECMPAVFEPIGSAMELLLPTGLLRKDGVAGKLVTDIPEDDWREGVEIVGWMYQYYVSERKDEVFASFKKGKKAERGAIAPATQLFTPHWIVRYLTENSLGRLWMLNHPDSKLVEKMPYFIKPDDEHETEFKHISSPEEITCVDPACGSGHILVYAFDLLAAMYEEAGYSNRDAARFIIEKNLVGLEIDLRAAAMASFALTMKACELDSRFLRRGVVPKVVVLERIEFESDELELCPNFAERVSLIDAVEHLDECGSLLQPVQDDLVAVEKDLVPLAEGASLFADSTAGKLERLLAKLRPLADCYDVVVANPPYMGTRNMAKWLSSYISQNYPKSKSDLYSCFIDRSFTLGTPLSYKSLIAMQTWMFLASFEAFRKWVLRNSALCSLIHVGSQCFDFGEGGHDVVSVAAFVLGPRTVNSHFVAVRLVEETRRTEKSARCLEALSEHNHSYYVSSGDLIGRIPGEPIAYWASDSFVDNFSTGISIDSISDYTGSQNITANNDLYLRMFWEVPASGLGEGNRWVSYSKGGYYRKWYGNLIHVVDWSDEAREFYESNSTSNLLAESYWYEEGITYTMLSSSGFSFRLLPRGCVFDKGGPSICKLGDKLALGLAFLNSSVATYYLGVFNPTLNLQAKDIKSLPLLSLGACKERIGKLANDCIDFGQRDWDSFETSVDFRRHPLV